MVAHERYCWLSVKSVQEYQSKDFGSVSASGNTQAQETLRKSSKQQRWSEIEYSSTVLWKGVNSEILKLGMIIVKRQKYNVSL